MNVERTDRGVTIELDANEAELLRLTLKRATFEDTPSDRQKAILDLAFQMLRELGEEE